MASDPRLALWRTPRSDWESAREDAGPYDAATPGQRLTDLRTLCRGVLRLLDALPADQRRAALWEQEPLPPAHEAAWRRLVARGRGG